MWTCDLISFSELFRFIIIPAGEQLCEEGSGSAGGRQGDHEPAACPGCQEGQWNPGVHHDLEANCRTCVEGTREQCLESQNVRGWKGRLGII